MGSTVLLLSTVLLSHRMHALLPHLMHAPSLMHACMRRTVTDVSYFRFSYCYCYLVWLHSYLAQFFLVTWLTYLVLVSWFTYFVAFLVHSLRYFLGSLTSLLSWLSYLLSVTNVLLLRT